MCWKVANQQPDPLRPAHEVNSQVKPSVAQVLMHAMALMREQRPASAEAMRQALREANRATFSAGRAANLPPTIVTPSPPSQGPTSPINPQPSQPAVPRPTQPSHSYPPPPPSPSWPNAQPPAQPGWQSQQPQPSWPSQPQPPQPSWPPAQPSPQPSWPNATQPWSGPAPSYAPPERKRTSLWVILSIVGVLVLGAIGLIAYGLMSDNSPSGGSPPKDNAVNNPPKTETYPAGNSAAPAIGTQPAPNANSNTASTDEAAQPGNVVDAILARYIQALGGEEAMKAISSRVMTGTFEIPSVGVSGTAEFYSKAPNKNLFILTVPGMATSRRGFNGSVGWDAQVDSSVKRVTGSELAALRRDSQFYRELNLRNDYTNMTLAGQEKIDGKDALVVVGTLADGSENKFCFDKQSGLLLRSDETNEKGTTQTFFSDYRTVDGVKLAFGYRQVTTETVATIRIQEVRHNVTINDTIFNPPSQ